MQKLKHFQVHPLVKAIKCPAKQRLLVFLQLTASRAAAALCPFVHPRGNAQLEGAKTNRRP